MMKKSLIALAVLGASGFAMAQSSVTLYGVADAGIGKLPVKGDKARFISGRTTNNAGPRVGFTGVEDLGNGNKAGFQYETGVRLEGGETAGGGTTFWARQANMFVGGNWGTLKLGRQFTPSYLANGAYDLTGQANYSVLDYTFGGQGQEKAYDFRGSSAIAYVTPNMSGFQAAIAFVHKNNIDPVNGKTAWDVGVWYKNGPLGVGLGVNKDVTSQAAGAKTNWHLGGKYAFGNFTVGAGWHKATTRRGFNLGVGAKFGAFTVTLDAVRVTKDATKKHTNAVLEGKYALSKRTFLYADVLRDGLVKETGWGLGIRHNF